VLELVYALWRRDMVKFLRDRQSIVASMARPFLWLFAMGFGLRGSVTMGGAAGVDYVSFLVPGIAIMTVLFASMFAAISIVWDREFGFLKELLVAPVPRSAIVAAKMLAGASMALTEVALMLLIAPLFGARFHVLGALAALPVLGVAGMTVNGLGIAIASRMRTLEGFGGIVNFIIQPLFFLSGALYPVDGLPRALAVAVRLNPMSYVVDAVRGVMLGAHHFPYALDLGVLVATAAVVVALATRNFDRMET
jgi:ABC-2 type transport system permease protein